MEEIEKIVPNQGRWRKPLEYYKEYMSYVEAFNKAVEEREQSEEPQNEINEPESSEVSIEGGSPEEVK